jgi:hypothetical protein
MRVNRGTLLKIARDTVAQRSRQDRTVFAAFLTGSLLGDDYLLGGTTDIDLTFVHTGPVATPREIVRLTDEIHLDISHYDQIDFRQTRELRLHPWLGPTLFGCQILFDPRHFMDFTQASVRGQFDRADYILNRSRQQAERSRQLWFAFYTEPPDDPGPNQVAEYLKAVEQAANAIASLSSSPLVERRLLLDFPSRAEAVDRPGLYPGLLGLLGAPNVDAGLITTWLDGWQAALEALPAEVAPPRLHLHRLVYYRQAFKSLLEGQRPETALWPLLHTWTLAINHLSPQAEGQAAWQEACGQLGLLGADFGERVDALDAYLDMLEETLDKWGRANGVL